MDALHLLLSELKKDDKVMFLLSGLTVSGNVISKEGVKNHIELSGVIITGGTVPGFQPKQNIAIPDSSILAWGKE